MKSIPSKHNVRLPGQGQWVRIYFFIVPNRSIEDCFHHSALTSPNTSYAVQRNESLQAGVGGRVTHGLDWRTTHGEGSKMGPKWSFILGL